MSDRGFPLWSDEPTAQDLLSFRAVASTVVDAVLDDGLDPIALGLSGAWGSGKTSVLELVKVEIERRSVEAETRVLVVPTQPWGYDPAVGPKESLIAEVLSALDGAIDESKGGQAKKLLKKLVGKVNWAKALKMAAVTSMTLQLPKPEDLVALIKEDSGKAEELSGDKGLARFREEFGALLASDGLKHISRVVVLVDDLDRCLPETVVETLEAIRLFLSAKGMSFVIAADEERVAEAIQKRLGTPGVATSEGETPAQLYLHKIVQTTIPLPGLSWFDTQAYLFLLLSHDSLDEAGFDALVQQCDNLRRSGSSLDDLVMPTGVDLAEPLATASRLTPILYEKFKGNPRRIKRFLNDLNVRQSVARRRGIELPSDAVAKLMVLERLLPEDFTTVVDWLATNELRDKLEALDRQANQAIEPSSVHEPNEDGKKPRRKPAAEAPPKKEESFSDTLIRWAKLPPELDPSAVSGYLYLAASFVGLEVVDRGLPERLRDIASALTSTLKIDRSAIKEGDLKALIESDAQLLVGFLGRKTRDQPALQKFTVAGMLRVADVHPGVESTVVAALKSVPAGEVTPATGLMLKTRQPDLYRPVLEAWKAGGAQEDLARTIDSVLGVWSNASGN
ncbi:KAP family P-loop NTPase fold protein [Amycolatopsis alkalitolerans]|uniref:KAP NTPase domain-containing protein n=1 Tax=Amycolatopsis alkalitolerans TaxID=2547244 RepID=A0A5C4LWB9_9PSEU|nr:P-loop NTPase fold protein [Amycolatopsis alkalitolerans]TNC23731.1 hypothetical protein FG385_20420 [Amycolatopsis alkalitolerans]